MNESFKARLRALLHSSDRLTSVSGEKNEALKRLILLAKGEELSVDDLRMLAAAADYDFRDLMLKSCLPSSYCTEEMILDFIEKEDAASLLLIASECIVRRNGEFYIVNFGTFRETNRIDPETMAQLRKLFLNRGYPMSARRISSELSYYTPRRLDYLICAQEDFEIYLFGHRGLKAPCADRLSIAIINSLCAEDQEMILKELVQSYRNFRNVKSHYGSFLTIQQDDTDVHKFIDRCEFEKLNSDSPYKDELIAMQDKYFRLTEA